MVTMIAERSATPARTRRRFWRGLAGVGAAILALAGGVAAKAATFQSLYSFSGGADGAKPYGQLAKDSLGRLLGTTSTGGTGNGGTVFRFDPATGLLTTLYSFTLGGATGSGPGAGVILDGQGMVYGTTLSGGSSASCAYGCGTVFKLNPTTGVITTLANFSGGSDGALPDGALLSYGGFLYGTTRNGGYIDAPGSAGYGTVFKLKASTKTLTTLHQFSLPGVDDGNTPMSSLAVGPDARLYGNASSGGANIGGVLFAINPTTAAFSLIHQFGYHVDGRGPDGKIIFRQGQIIGTTIVGGPTASNYGTVFSVDPNTGLLTNLYSVQGGAEGVFPEAGVVAGPHGRLYGPNNQGGSSGAGTVFSINATTHAFTLLHDFIVSDGSIPSGALLYDGSTTLYGLTSGGNGTIYKIVP